MSTATTLRLGPADHGRAMTLREFLDAEEEPGYRYELARGALEVTHVPKQPHRLLDWFFYEALAAYHREHPDRIFCYGGAGEFRLWLPGMESGRNPDVAVVLQGAPTDDRGERVPFLAIEVVSEGDEARERDHVTKRSEYLAYGLFEYWIVDPFARTVTVLMRRGPMWDERVFAADQEAEGRLLPGLRIALPALWASADAH